MDDDIFGITKTYFIVPFFIIEIRYDKTTNCTDFVRTVRIVDPLVEFFNRLDFCTYFSCILLVRNFNDGNNNFLN